MYSEMDRVALSLLGVNHISLIQSTQGRAKKARGDIIALTCGRLLQSEI
jgi:hypothetical protein